MTQQYLPQDMFRASMTEPGLLWSNSFLQYTMSAQLSLIMQDRKAAAYGSLFFHLHKYPWAQTVGHYEAWSVKGPIDLRGWGRSCMDSQEREWEQRSEGSHVCMYTCICAAADLEMQPPSWTHSRTSTHFLYWFWGCSAAPAPLSSFVHVLFRVQTSYGFIKLPKERKCGSYSDFPLQMIIRCNANFIKWNGSLWECFWNSLTRCGYTTPRVHCRQSLLVQGTDN